MQYLLRRHLLLVMIVFLTLNVSAQRKKKKSTPLPPAPVTVVPAPKTGPKPFKDVITSKAVSTNGLFNVHKVEDKWYFELPDSVFNRDIMAITRYSKVAAGAGAYGGELVNQQVIRWEKGPANNVFLRVVTTVSVAKDSASPIFQAVRNSNLNPIGAAFDVKAFGKDSGKAVVIEVTEFFKGDNQVVSLSPSAKRTLNLSSILGDRSYIDTIKTFPINTEIRTVKTFSATPPSPFGSPGGGGLPAATSAGVVTLELNNSFILLPEKPMRKRLFDRRVGYYADNYTEYSDDQQKVEKSVFAVRWRLEPKDEDREKWKKGELVEPKKPIIYYIDPATPKKWRPYLIEGVNNWNTAFEKAGFKNAIMGKEWPENDSTMSLEDARYSVLRYFASNVQNAYGPNVHDPRSGEIIESHIGWYHNVMSLLHDWYFIQGAAVDPRARKVTYDDTLMGELIRFVSSHEVGHTLGLLHNMGASNATPVEKLRDKTWLEKYGHTVSIMDYARFNYVAQPGDGITNLLPKISVYDKWAIEWGYKPVPESLDEEEEKKLLNKWVMSHENDPMYWFGGEGTNNDPRAQTESLGDNNMKAGEYGIRNLKRIMANVTEWTKEEADPYKNLDEIYKEIFAQYNRYVYHVTKNIGGIYETFKTSDQKGDVYKPTPKAIQKEAMLFLNRQLFTTPSWLLDKNVLNRIAEPSTDRYSSFLDNVMGSLLSTTRLSRMIATSNRETTAYTIEEYYKDLKKSVWTELPARSVITVYRRDLQKSYVNKMIALIAPPSSASGTGTISFLPSAPVDGSKSDIGSLTRANLQILRTEIRAAIPFMKNNMSRYHLQDIAERIKTALSPRE
ncbi:MAG: zinc-dependent metalloprotease [Chitinophagaceae bacterium]|nr:zinc-dependent metalloprotease [Chitinophagaceae bacterium]